MELTIRLHHNLSAVETPPTGPGPTARVLMLVPLSADSSRDPDFGIAAVGMCKVGRVLLIDAANVVGSRPTGWWRDRPKAAAEFVARVRATPGLPSPVVIVIEGAARAGVAEGSADGVEVVHAPGEGDDIIVAVARQAGAAGEGVTVVSADRALGDRCRTTGSEIVGPTWLLDRLAR